MSEWTRTKPVGYYHYRVDDGLEWYFPLPPLPKRKSAREELRDALNGYKLWLAHGTNSDKNPSGILVKAIDRLLAKPEINAERLERYALRAEVKGLTNQREHWMHQARAAREERDALRAEVEELKAELRLEQRAYIGADKQRNELLDERDALQAKLAAYANDGDS